MAAINSNDTDYANHYLIHLPAEQAFAIVFGRNLLRVSTSYEAMMNHKCFKTKIVAAMPLLQNEIAFAGSSFVYFAANDFNIVLQSPIPFLDVNNTVSANIQSLSNANIKNTIYQCMAEDRQILKAKHQILTYKYEHLKHKYHGLKAEQQVKQPAQTLIVLTQTHPKPNKYSCTSGKRKIFTFYVLKHHF